MLKLNFKLCITASLLSLLATNAVYADDGGFHIKDYNVTADITESRVYNVEEDINVNFSEERHGIERIIPGAKVEDYYEISDVKVLDQPFDIITSSSDTTIRIGDSNKKVIGDVPYKINYKLVHGEDEQQGYDHIYLNLIGTDWNCKIDNAHLVVNMPTDKIDYVNITYGEYKSTQNLNYTIEGNSVIVDAQQLQPNEGVTAEIRVPEGTFKDTKVYGKYRKEVSLGALLFGLLLLVGSVVCWFAFGRNRKIVKNICYYPPDKLSPLEIGYLYDRSVDPKDISSMIVYWASKGYLDFERTDKKRFVLTKLKDIENVDKYEKDLFDGMWSCGKDGKVKSSQLERSFYKYTENIPTYVSDKFEDDKDLYDKKSLRISELLYVVIAIMIVAFFGLFVLYEKCGIIETVIVAGVFTIIALIISSFAKRCIKGLSVSKFNIVKLIIAFFGAVIISLLASSMLTKFLDWNMITVALIFMIIALVVVSVIARYSDYYDRMRDDIAGFRVFLKTAEKDRLEKLIDENPAYYYDILPYANVLGVSKKWSNKFKGIVKEAPSWYKDNFNTFEFMAFNGILYGSLYGTAHSSEPVSKSIGSYGGSYDGGGGGGFSGGGSGGGGGGSW